MIDNNVQIVDGKQLYIGTNTLDSIISGTPALTGITYDTATDKTTIDNNLTIPTGKDLVLGSTNIGTQVNKIDSIETAITNITYAASGDITTIDNNLTIPTGKDLLLGTTNIGTEVNKIDSIESATTGITYGPGANGNETAISNNVSISEDLTIQNAFTQVGGGNDDFVSFRNGKQILSRNGSYEKYEVSGEGSGAQAAPRLYFQGNNATATDDKMLMDVTGDIQASSTVRANGVVLTSDDRIKENEKLIVNATETLSKLTPQTYDKYQSMDLIGSSTIESGLIAQEVYYNAPELRHLINLGKELDASGNEYTPTPEEMDLSGVDIANDPDYGSHGWSKTEQSGLHYQGLIPYLIKSNQEMAERLAALENK